MSFGEILQAIRKKNQLSQEALADMLGVSRQAVSKWELGDGYPEVDKLLILSKKLNVSLDSLLGAESAPASPAAEKRPDTIRIISPHEGVIVSASKVARSQQFPGGKTAPSSRCTHRTDMTRPRGTFRTRSSRGTGRSRT